MHTKVLPYLVLVVCHLGAASNNNEGVSSSTSEFATRFYRVLAKRSTDDFVICPFCLSSTLAMLSMGATGNTLEELRSGAGISRNLSSFESIKSSIQSYKHLRTIRMLNGLLLPSNNAVQVNPDFDSALANYFGDHVHFIPPGMAKDDAVQMLVEDRLNVPSSDEDPTSWEDSSSKLTRGSMTLVNYLNFYGGWEKRFDSLSTTQEPFLVSPGEVIMVKMMRQTGHFHVAHLPQLKVKAISLPYLLCAGNVYANVRNRTVRAKKKKVTCKSGVRDSRFHMVVLMPYESDDGMHKLEANLTGELFQSVLRKFQYKSYLDLSFPSFRLKSKGDLINSVGNLVQTGKGDYGKISKSGRLSLDSVFHSVTVTVEERGSRTKSSLLKGPNIQPRMFKVNRPFVGFIHDKKQDVVLSAFRVSRPLAPP